MLNNLLLDVRLLLVFEALRSEQSTTRAARRLGLSQPAVSNALHRLREVLGDELFRRSGDGMRPTPRALELATPVGQVLRQLEAVLQPAQFEPSQSDRTFRLALSPPVATFLLPPLAQKLASQASGIKLVVQTASSAQASMLLDSQAVDMIVTVVPAPPKRFPSEVLYRDSYVGLMRKGHPLARAPMRLERFAAADHLLVTQTQQSYNLFDDAIAKHGLQRTIRMVANDWMTAGEMISRTDLVTAVFKRTGETMVGAGGGRLVTRPLKLPSFDVLLLWHETFTKHPAYEWLKQQIFDCCGTVR